MDTIREVLVAVMVVVFIAFWFLLKFAATYGLSEYIIHSYAIGILALVLVGVFVLYNLRR